MATSFLHEDAFDTGCATVCTALEVLRRRLQASLADRRRGRGEGVVADTHRSALRQVFKGIELEGAAIEQLHEAFDALLQSMDEQVQRLIAGDVQLASGCERLRTITGIGSQTSALLAMLLSRFDFANADAVVAYNVTVGPPCKAP